MGRIVAIHRELDQQHVTSATGYTPSELMYGLKRCNILGKLVPNLLNHDEAGEGLEEKLEKAYYKIRKRAEARKRRRKRGNTTWEPVINERVLVRTQPISDAVRGITAKFMDIYEGPFLISKNVGHAAYEIKDEKGKVRGEFNKRQLKPYKGGT